MTETTITIPVDAATAQSYLDASNQERQRIDLLLRLRLRELTSQPKESLESLLSLMDEMGKRAEERGLTPEILEEILRGE